jgi:G3E family GTPase
MTHTNTNDQRIPITLLTGFLGAGKTTLVNRILSAPESGKTAVIVNEFGDIGIDGDLITKTSEDMLELSNGCICCSSKDDLIEALYKLYMRKAGLAEPKVEFDRVVIETTGLADPTPLAQAFYMDMSLSLTYRLDAIITLVDVKHVESQLRDAPEARRQVAMADKIIFNKRDLVGDAEYARAVDVVNALNPFSPKETASYGSLDLSHLVDLNLFDPNTKESAISAWLGDAAAPAAHSHHHHEHHDHAQDGAADCPACLDSPALRHAAHLDGITAISMRETHAMDYQKLMEFLERLSLAHGANLYRVKGLVRFSGIEKPVILQGVQTVFSPLACAEKWPGGDTSTRLVIIGKHLDKIQIATGFAQCVAAQTATLDRSLCMI